MGATTDISRPGRQGGEGGQPVVHFFFSPGGTGASEEREYQTTEGGGHGIPGQKVAPGVALPGPVLNPHNSV